MLRRCLFWLLTLSALFAIPAPAADGPPPPMPFAEFRGAWIATVHNIDWPSKAGLSAAAQRAQLTDLLDEAAALRLNAIILQVRPSCDALYESRLEPWSAFLSGKSGVSPGYDPLAFAVKEAHARGLELHAWFNPFRAKAGAGEAAATHVSRTHPEWLRPFAGQTWLDPGEPAARAHTLAVIQDVVRRYDIDGIHIDDYFYPYPVRDAAGNRKDIPFPDDATFAAHGRGMTRDDWRRDNINTFVRALYATVKNTKRHVKLGISPFGIWKPGYPAGIEAQLDAVTDIYADSRHWLRQGWCDYFTPQLYWSIEPPAQSYSALLGWWGEQTRARHVWPGIAPARISTTGSGESPRRAGEILTQVELARRTRTPGVVHWSFRALKQDRDGVSTTLKAGLYAAAAAVPACPWLGGEAPAAPGELRTAKSAAGGWKVTWNPAGARRWLVQSRRGDGEWRVERAVFAPDASITFPAREGAGVSAVSVRAVSPSGALGPAVTVAMP